jgi:hypothetical protein
MTFFETIASALILAFISAVTFVAYKHPKSYHRLYLYLAVVALALVGAATIWNASNSRALLAVPMDTPGYDAIRERIDALAAPLWTPLVAFALIAYLIFLSFLPNFLEHDDRHKGDEPED